MTSLGNEPIKPPTFQSISSFRKTKNTIAGVVFSSCFVVVLVPLVWLLATVVMKGASALTDPAWWTSDQYAVDPQSFGGGVAHAIYGTVVQALVAAVIAVPLGILVGIMLVEYPSSKLNRAITFMVDILAGVPSIVAALFVFSLWVMSFGFGQSAFAVSLALVLLMLPLIVRSTEEMLKLVPNDLREAAYALGIPKWKTIVRIVLPTAMSGMVSGIFLAIARAMGETAPVLLLVGTSTMFNINIFSNSGMSSLPLFIYEQFNSSYAAGQFKFWGAALTLIIIVAIANVIAALAAKFLSPKGK